MTKNVTAINEVISRNFIEMRTSRRAGEAFSLVFVKRRASIMAVSDVRDASWKYHHRVTSVNPACDVPGQRRSGTGLLVTSGRMGSEGEQIYLLRLAGVFVVWQWSLVVSIDIT